MVLHSKLLNRPLSKNEIGFLEFLKIFNFKDRMATDLFIQIEAKKIFPQISVKILNEYIDLTKKKKPQQTEMLLC